MDLNAAVWANAEHTFVRLVDEGVEYLIPAAPENRRYAELLGGDVQIGTYSPLPPQVPEAVRRYQGLIALLGIGIAEQAIRDKITLIEDPGQREMTRLRFEQPEWRRDSEFIAWGAAAFDLSASEVDQLFIDAWAA